MRDGRNISKKVKNKKKPLLLFKNENKYFFRKHIWKNLVYIVTFVLQFFRVAGYSKSSDFSEFQNVISVNFDQNQS